MSSQEINVASYPFSSPLTVDLTDEASILWEVDVDSLVSELVGLMIGERSPEALVEAKHNARHLEKSLAEYARDAVIDQHCPMGT